MAAGDASKTWFDEVIQHMTDSWSKELTWEEVIVLCGSLTRLRDQIRSDRNIKSPMFICDKCDDKHPMILAPVSVRGVLFALQKEGVIMQESFDSLVKDWLKFQRKNKLDAFGKIKKITQKASAKVEDKIKSGACH